MSLELLAASPGLRHLLKQILTDVVQHQSIDSGLHDICSFEKVVIKSILG